MKQTSDGKVFDAIIKSSLLTEEDLYFITVNVDPQSCSDIPDRTKNTKAYL